MASADPGIALSQSLARFLFAQLNKDGQITPPLSVSRVPSRIINSTVSSKLAGVFVWACRGECPRGGNIELQASLFC